MSAPTRLDWGRAYEQAQRNTAQTLRDLRKQGAVRYQFGDGGPGNVPTCDPSRMSDRAIDEAARWHAETVCNRGINQEIERRRKRGEPLHGMVESL